MNTTSKTTCTTCPYCGVGCGVAATVQANGETLISGDSAHPANRGNLCLKGYSLAETIGHEDRLLHPIVDGKQASWNTATNRIATEFKRCIDTYGPESVAFYVSGQLLTEDYYVVNKFVKGYLGTANIDTNSRLCMASSVAGHKRAFGSDTVPGCYEDLELADLVILVGSNLAWCHPVLFGRITAARDNNPDLRVINIDPRRTATSELADSQLSILPDGDTALFNGLLQWLIENNHTDENYINSYTSGFGKAKTAVKDMDLATVSKITGLSPEALTEFYATFVNNERVVTVYSQGVNQSASGTDKVNSIINCHLVTGRIGKPGCGPFSITGQPNAMGGRETGGLSNMLTCHMELNNEFHRTTVKEFWGSPRMAAKPGLKAVELFEAVQRKEIRAIWIMATNPVASMPNADFVAQALSQCEFVVQSDVIMNNNTADYAHVRLPAQGWGEKDGTVTNSERCISRQRRFKTPLAETKPDWWAVSQVASVLGYESAFSYEKPSDIFTEYAKLSGTKNGGSRDFDISTFRRLTDNQYDKLKPFYWPSRTSASEAPVRFFSEGDFYTADGKGHFIATESPTDNDIEASTKDQSINKQVDQAPQFRLNTGRIRDHWHTMTRTGLSATLSSHIAEPFVEIHPTDAKRANVASADLALVKNERGTCILRVLVTDKVKPGSLFAPMHWCKPYANAGRIDVLTSSVTDPVSGQPALKHSMVNLEKLAQQHFGFAVTSEPLSSDGFNYFATARCKGGWRSEFAINNKADLHELCSKLIVSTKDTETLELNDPERGISRKVAFSGNKLVAAVYMAHEPVLLTREWLIDALTKPHNDKTARHSILAARAPGDMEDHGRLVCTCFNIGEKQIINAITNKGCHTISCVSKELEAGTNCGSCRSDIAGLIKSANAVITTKSAKPMKPKVPGTAVPSI